MTSRRFFNSIIPIGACITLLTCGCSAITEIGGVVVDGDGQPIENAVVTMFVVGNANVSNDAKTDAEGAFLVGLSHGAGVDAFGLTVKCDGYRVDRRTVFAFDDYDYRIVLERVDGHTVTADPDDTSTANHGLQRSGRLVRLANGTSLTPAR